MGIAGLIMQSLSRNKFVSPTTAGTLRCNSIRDFNINAIIYKCDICAKLMFGFIFALVGTFFFMQILNRIKFKDAIFVPLIGINVW